VTTPTYQPDGTTTYPQDPAQPSYDALPVLTPPVSHTGRNVTIAALLIAAAIGTAVAISSGTSGSTTPNPGGGSTAATDFNDPTTLGDDIMNTTNSKSGSNDITSVTCLPAGPHQFSCLGEGSDGSSYSVTATVSADGQSWQTSN
jgi:hypothetical protein